MIADDNIKQVKTNMLCSDSSTLPIPGRKDTDPTMVRIWMSTMEAISLTTAPANASEIALGKDVDLEERRHLQDLGLPLHHHLLSHILLYPHRGP